MPSSLDMSPDSLDLEQFHDSVVAASAGDPNSLRWGNYFIKIGNPQLLYEAKTQTYLYEKAVLDSNAPGIPKVISCFRRNNRTYLVSEFIDAPTIETWLQHTDSSQQAYGYRAVANALEWLHRVSPPSDVLIGQVGGGPALHKLFQDDDAPLNFTSVDAVERFVNAVCECLPSEYRPPPVSFSGEKSVFTQSNPIKGNFLMDAGRIVLLGFEHVSLLPESLVSYTMHRTEDDFVKMVARYLPLEQSPNIPTLSVARRLLHTHAETTFGLNEHGYPVHK